jgi:cobalt/nickel transport system ATP-binding protein
MGETAAAAMQGPPAYSHAVLWIVIAFVVVFFVWAAFANIGETTVGVSHLKNRPPHRLSTGQKRRVAIASVLSMSPDILVMDEPSAGLDPRARTQLIELLKSFEHTKIIATHDLDMVVDLCQRTIVMHDGLVSADGPTLEIFSDEKLLAESCLEKPLRMQGCPVCRCQ